MVSTHQSLQLVQWIIGDPSSGFLQTQYALELCRVTLDLPGGPGTFTLSDCSRTMGADSCAKGSVRDGCRERAAERVDMVEEVSAAWEDK